MAKKDDRRERFCLEYLIDFNGARAAKAAGFSVPGASVQANRLLNEPAIQARLATLKAKRNEQIGISALGVMERVDGIAQKAEKDCDYPNALRGLDMLGKHTGAYDADNTLHITEDKARALLRRYVDVVASIVEPAQLKAITAKLEDMGDA